MGGGSVGDVAESMPYGGRRSIRAVLSRHHRRHTECEAEGGACGAELWLVNI